MARAPACPGSTGNRGRAAIGGMRGRGAAAFPPYRFFGGASRFQPDSTAPSARPSTRATTNR